MKSQKKKISLTKLPRIRRLYVYGIQNIVIWKRMI